MEAAATTTAVPDPRRWKALALVCAAFFMTVLDVSIVNVALPSIGRRRSTSRATEPAVGDHRLRDHVRRLPAARRPRRRPARPPAGLPHRRRRSSPIASLVCGLAWSEGVLIAARAVQGLGAAIDLAGGALDHHDDVRRRPRAQQGARHLGRDRRLRRRGRRARRRHPHEVPRLGVDLLRQRPGRRARAPARAALRAREPRRPRRRPDFDVAGAVTVTAGLALLVYAISKAPDHGWGSSRTTIAPRSSPLAAARRLPRHRERAPSTR